MCSVCQCVCSALFSIWLFLLEVWCVTRWETLLHRFSFHQQFCALFQMSRLNYIEMN